MVSVDGKIHDNDERGGGGEEGDSRDRRGSNDHTERRMFFVVDGGGGGGEHGGADLELPRAQVVGQPGRVFYGVVGLQGFLHRGGGQSGVR